MPILKGVSIIHLYSTKKLSRNSENSESSNLNKFYKEIEILYGTEIKNNPNIEFRYIEPTKLQEVERFLFEFFVSISRNIELFYTPNHDIKYFDYTLLNKISEILLSNKNASRDNIFTKINNYYFENSMKNKFQGTNPVFEMPKIINNPYYFMVLPQEQFFSEFYHFTENQIKNQDKSFIDVTLNLSRIEEVKCNNSNI